MTPEDIRIPVDGSALSGDLVLPSAGPVVVFAHGSGSSRHSPRNRAVAAELRRAGLGTLLLDLLTADEERTDLLTARFRFDIGLLSDRLVRAVDWLAAREDAAPMPVGVFGASTGAAAALRTAAERPGRVQAVVSRGGRPDLAGDSALRRVQAPVLLIVGGDDQEVLRLNREAAELLHVPNRVEVIPGATHLFEEPGALEEVARLAREWFLHPGSDGRWEER
ncbi:alpha/beta fold hydrolase [Streptomyces sp. ISL-43]|uniref:dienelactone hydrolase family protein n=1 Tax=Streptomyces sp. ISL-43 TaxID=2819183 RepID=UPI001BEA5B66|nr:alpha/beta fold hydrolase [Streptomyces sp. ISL-43]MBT2448640.1 alpha/beta fold hydrolase [Streptomyces sp. ISL-43]